MTIDIPAPAEPHDRDEREQALRKALDERILVMDGATGTALQAADLTADDFGGPELEGCNENLVRTRPDVVDRVHETYLSAGADVVETDTFGATPLVLAEYGLGTQAFEINRLAAEIARAACARHSTPERPRFVCGSMGPTTKALSVTGGVTFEELDEHFRVQALGSWPAAPTTCCSKRRRTRRNVKAGTLRHRAGLRAVRLAAAGRRLGHHRDHRHHARRPGRRGARGLAPPRRPALLGAQLRHRPGADDRPPPHALRDRPHPRRLRPQRRAAGRRGPLPGRAGDVRGRLHPLLGSRLAQPGRRLLRHYARARGGPRRSRAALPAAAGARPPPLVRLGARSGRADRRRPAACWSASAPTCWAAAPSSSSSATASGSPPPRSPAPRWRPGRRWSTSACRTRSATRSRTWKRSWSTPSG
jgi:hypothetical protein